MIKVLKRQKIELRVKCHRDNWWVSIFSFSWCLRNVLQSAMKDLKKSFQQFWKQNQIFENKEKTNKNFSFVMMAISTK